MAWFAVESSIADIKRLRVNPHDFEPIKLIGQGHFGQVKVVEEKSSGEIYALKIIRKKDVLSHQEVSTLEFMNRLSKMCYTYIKML